MHTHSSAWRAARMRRCHTVRRTRIESNTRTIRLHHVADSAICVDEAGFLRLVQLASQPLNVDIDGVREGIVAFVPNVFRYVGAGDDLTCALGEKLQQCVLFTGEVDDLPTARSAATLQIER